MYFAYPIPHHLTTIFKWKVSNFIRYSFYCRKEHFEIAFDTLKKEDSEAGDTYIPVESLRKLLTSLGETMTDEEVEELIEDMDNDKDGKIGHQEFMEILMRD